MQLCLLFLSLSHLILWWCRLAKTTTVFRTSCNLLPMLWNPWRIGFSKKKKLPMRFSIFSFYGELHRKNDIQMNGHFIFVSEKSSISIKFSFGVHWNYAISISINYRGMNKNACKWNERVDSVEVVYSNWSAYKCIHTLLIFRMYDFSRKF